MPYSCKEKRRAYFKEYAKTYKHKEYLSIWRKDNKEKINSYNNRWVEQNKDRFKLTRKTWSLRKRQEILELLGGKCCQCGFDDNRALQVDHVFSDGHEHRKTFGHTSSALYRAVKESLRLGDGRLQLLCANCNWIKRYEKKELFRNGRT